MMFTSLPRRCVVLLEDIDAAGLNKRQEGEKVEKANEEDATAKMGAEITKAFKSIQKNEKDKQGITLSGLLNAIDGVASHEGRVLVMTTNFPDKLDEALVRPGRIDMKVKFTNATRSQIYELFMRMYTPNWSTVEVPDRIRLDTGKAAKENSCPVANESTLSGKKHLSEKEILEQDKISIAMHKAKDLTIPDTPVQSFTPKPTTIEATAIEFALSLPEDTFTPAEIQGFLLTRKKEPDQALREVEAWKKGVLEAREKKSRMEAEGV